MYRSVCDTNESDLFSFSLVHFPHPSPLPVKSGLLSMIGHVDIKKPSITVIVCLQSCSRMGADLVLLFLRNSVGGDIVTRPFVGGWVSGCVRQSVPLYLVGAIQTTVFAQSLSNFTCELLMMRGGTLLILGHRVKGQGQLRHSVYKTLCTRYRLQSSVILSTELSKNEC